MQAKQPSRSNSSSWQDDKTVDRRVVNTFFAATSFITSITRSRSATSFFRRAFSLKLPQLRHVTRLSCRRNLMNFVSAAPKAPHKLALILSQEAKLLLAMDRYEPGVMAAQVAIRAFDRQRQAAAAISR